MASRVRLILLGLVLALGLDLGFHVRTANAAVEVNISFFYDRLAPYGHWFKHRRYGYVWYPIGVEFGWRPYTHGHWVWTPDYGWYWDSDYYWGWGPFHYGRWVFDDDYGWVWVPGHVWGPAWVFWRWGHGFIGWAPMPPEAVWDEGVGLRFGGFDPDSDRFRPSWIFVDQRHFLAPRLHDLVLTPERNVTILRQTTNMTKYVAIKNRIVNEGLNVDQVEKVTNKKVPRARIADVDRPARVLMERDGENAVPVFRPKVKPTTQAAPPAATDSGRRQKAGQAILEDEQGAQIEQMDRRHKLERERAGKNLDQLKKQQDTEYKALQQQQQREKGQLRNRQKEWPYYPYASPDQ